ncbi:hypothetical protein [Treponema denticola]|uniref:Uncharacterized protein n=1 Tax=Treponema denticola SP33 TaxID=999437 RepID=M2BK41_TREDN|nr:hypothetical protein [Treponema denticola]EMB21873.1 hypothetical protein HMPREF9733_02210 [Treponema denticola SP33]EPF36006.1 hypothetical protein HMPREF9732_02240 [Treponema denticola SP32]
MALDFNKIEEPDDSVFPVKLEDDSNLDMYGVWVKKRPEHKDSYESVSPVENENAEAPFENDILEFDDHDIINLDNPDEPLEFEELTTLNNFETIKNEDSNKTEEHLENVSITSEDDIYGDEFDIFDEADAVVIDEEEKDDFDIDLDVMPKAEEETTSDINEFETLDLDDFLSDSEAIESTDKNEDKDEDGSLEPDDNIKLDLSFDEDYLETKESDAIDFEGNESFEITSDEPDTSETSAENKTLNIENLPERTIDDISDFDEILDELEVNDESNAEDVEELSDEIPLNITIDEYSDISSLAGKTMGGDDDLEDVEIFSDISEFEEAENVENTEEEKKEDDGLVIESTIIEAGNIDEIRKENQKIMADSSTADEEKTEEAETIDDFDSMLDSVMGESAETENIVEENGNMFFDDIEALENDLLDSGSQEIPEEFGEDISVIQSHKKNDGAETAASQSNVLANDKATEILTQIASELVSIKNELANMKFEMAQTQQKLEDSNISTPQENTITDSILNDVAESDKTGFFNDDDGDETIALTGDELNNILITADFTEENTEKDYEIPETLDEIDGAFLDDDNLEKDTKDEPEVFADNDLLNALEPEHINDLTEDISYLDEDVELNVKDEPDEKIEEIEIEDFLSDDIPEEPALEDHNLEDHNLEDHNLDESAADDGGILDDFDMTITELELPDGQSIPLGDEYSGFEAITENIEEGHDEAADFEPESEETVKQDIKKSDDISWEDNSLSTATYETDIISKPEDIPEIISENHEDAVFSPEELDQAAQDIPRLELNESAAEEQKVKTETLPIHLKDEIKSVLTYMDQLLESLPEEKIEEFAKSEYFDTYKRLFDELGIS